MENYTILGGSGFIGSNLAKVLANRIYDATGVVSRDNPFCPTRAQLYSIDDRNLGHVFYCLGDDSGEVESNLGYLLWFIKSCSFKSLVYLSSTRVYLGALEGDEEARLMLSPSDPGYRFNAIKLAAEQICLSHPKGKVARLSTVVGLNDGDYLVPGLIKDALRTGVMNLYLGPGVIRDLIAIEDVVELLPKLRTGKYRIYNVASGINTTVAQIVSAIEDETGAKAVWHPCGYTPYPWIWIGQIQKEFDFVPRPVLPSIRALCRQYDDIYVKQVMA